MKRQKRKNRSAGALLALALLASGCVQPGGFRMEGRVSLRGCTEASLVDMEGDTLCHAPVEGGTFRMELPGRPESEPFAARLLLPDTCGGGDLYELPVMVERGTVRLTLGEYVHTGGTPLNEAVQEFLDGLQAVKESCLSRSGMTEEELEDTFSGYYAERIAAHRRDALGTYILRSYGIHLTEGDRRRVEAMLPGAE